MDFDVGGIFSFLVKNITNGGSGGVISILLVAIGYLGWDRRNMVKRMSDRDEKLDKVIEGYYEMVLQVSNTLSGIKQVLLVIKSKL